MHADGASDEMETQQQQVLKVEAQLLTFSNYSVTDRWKWGYFLFVGTPK